MGVGATMQSLAEILSSDSGSLVLGIAALVAIAAPFIDRYFIRRRRLTFRVLYNSKIGLSPIDLHDGENGSAQADPQLERTARLLNRMSVVVIRIHNTGGFDIAPGDFEIRCRSPSAAGSSGTRACPTRPTTACASTSATASSSSRGTRRNGRSKA